MLEHVLVRMTMVLVKADGRAYCTVNVGGVGQQWGGFSKTETDPVGSTPLMCVELFRAIESHELSRPQAADRRDAIATDWCVDCDIRSVGGHKHGGVWIFLIVCRLRHTIVWWPYAWRRRGFSYGV